MNATITRTRKNDRNSYHLTTINMVYRIYRGRGRNFIKSRTGNRPTVYFNEYLFPQFDEIHMRYNRENDTWEMAHTYRQVSGGASAPYERLGEADEY
jgi:hypothetical protein